MAYQMNYTGNEADNGLSIAFSEKNNINLIPTVINKVNANIDLLDELEAAIATLNNPLEVCNTLYPIGALYMNDGNINPNNLFPGTSWQLINTINDKDYINNYFGTSNLDVVTWTDGSKWVPLVLHNATGGTTVYASAAEALQCTNSNKISNLYLFQREHNIFKDKSGFYEFILEYPGLNNYQRWKQRSNPVLTYDAVANYIPIHIPWTAQYWGGMARHSASISSASSTFLSGSINHGNWYYALCSFVNYSSGGIPGPGDFYSGWVKFYVRVSQLEEENFLTDDFNLLKHFGVKYWRRIG